MPLFRYALSLQGCPARYPVGRWLLLSVLLLVVGITVCAAPAAGGKKPVMPTNPFGVVWPWELQPDLYAPPPPLPGTTRGGTEAMAGDLQLTSLEGLTGTLTTTPVTPVTLTASVQDRGR